MRKLLIAVGVIVAVVIVAGIAAPYFLSVEAYKDRIVAQVRDATGRDMKIAGPLSLALFPDITNVTIEAADVSVANPPGTQSPTLAKVKKLLIEVKIMPLLSGRIELERLVLIDPSIDLEIDAKGRPNWDLTPAAATQPAAQSPAEAPSVPNDASEAAGLDALSRLQVQEVKIENGDIVLIDRRNDQREELQQGAVTLSAPSLDAPFTMSGSALWRGQKIAFATKLDATGALLHAGGKTGFTASLTAKPVSLHFAGNAANTGKGGVAALAFDGKADLAMPSVRDFIAWSGRNITLPKQGFGALALSGTVHAADRVAHFTDAKISLDTINANGAVTLDLTHVKPAIAANLQTGMLDLNPYLPPPVPGWSTRQFDIAMFRGVDADATIAAEGVKFRRMTIGRTDIVAHLKDAKLALDIGRMALYRGSGKGQVQLDATGAAAAIQISGSVTGVDIAPLSRDAAGIDPVSGSGSFTLTGTARGNSERDLVGSLAGKASFRMSNGSVGGIDLGGMLKNSSGAFGKGGGRTAIARASASFTISRGMMRNGDLSVSADAIDATGSGTVDLPGRSLNYRITPKLMAGIVTVPVIVSGSWDHLNFQPDVAGIAKGLVQTPGNVLGGAAGVGKDVGRGIGGALKSLFGN